MSIETNSTTKISQTGIGASVTLRRVTSLESIRQGWGRWFCFRLPQYCG